MNKNKKHKNTKKKWAVAGLVFLILYAISLFAPLISPFTKLPLYIIKCGGMPITASNFAAGNHYDIPSEGWNVTPFHDYFFCSETEAEAAGFNKSSRGHKLD